MLKKAGDKMEVVKITVDRRPPDCAWCPLTRPHTRGCGRTQTSSCNGGLSVGKVPDARCRLTEAKQR